MSGETTWHLFEGYGVELEYMIVDAETLSVRPIADKLLHDVAGAYLAEIELGELAWSNELVLHVVELKTNGPASSLGRLPEFFQNDVRRINALLEPHGARLMPTAMHPWMDPQREMRLWPHEYNPVYEAYNRIFDCRGHGWANLQSVHLNLPFDGDEEFGRLHAAIRLLLPLLPALAASSPVVERKLTGLQDNRLEAYRHNGRRVPSLAADVIPEPVFTRDDYQREIFERMYRDIAPHDPDKTLRHEWLNARGAIARFDRGAIEIRVLDVQECPQADVAICAAISAVLQALTQERWTSTEDQQRIETQPLKRLLLATIRDAEQAVVEDRAYLDQLGFPGRGQPTAAEVWRHLAETVLSRGSAGDTISSQSLDVILQHGPLSRRINRALTADPPAELETVYRELCDCLHQGRRYVP